MTIPPAHGAPRESEQSSASNGKSHPPEEALAALRRRLEEFLDYASYYLAARIDAVKVVVRHTLLLAAAGIVGLFAVLALIITAVVLVCIGIADALGSVLGNHRWAGDLITGGVILGALALAVLFGMKIIDRASLRATTARYEKLRQKQRQRHGRDVSTGHVSSEVPGKTAPSSKPL
jgi:hypothetical protein